MILKAPFKMVIPEGSNGFSYIVDANGVEIATNYHAKDDYAEPREIVERLNHTLTQSEVLEAYRKVLIDQVKRST